LTQSRRAQALARGAASQAASQAPATSAASASEARSEATGTTPTTAPKKKLSYKEQRELENLPGLIEALEQEQKAIQGELADGSLYRTDGARAARLAERSTQIDDALIVALERWELLG
jgi:ATP-binding cassette subfamily F protein uup